MQVFHGTSDSVATALAASPSTVSVSAGGGELGRGFYAGDSIALAAAWARGRHAAAKVLQIDVANSSYAALAILTLNHFRVTNTWSQLQHSGQERTYLFGYDVVYGPLATNPHAGQHKFESAAAELVLHAAQWTVL